MIWNLSERDYEYELLDNQIVCFPFKDHHAPPLHIIFQIIHHIDSWLRANHQHVAVVHCTGGKGRTGLIIVCFLFYSGLYANVSQCLSWFAARRSAKAKGVTQPSQLRYVKYFSEVVSGARQVLLIPLCLQYVALGPVPKGMYVYIEVYQQIYAEVYDEKEKVLYSSYAPSEARVTDKDGRLWSECNVELLGDMLVRGFCVEGKSKPKPLFRLQFHTGMLDSMLATFPKAQLDDMHKEKKRFPSEFELKLGFVASGGDRRTMVMYNTIFNQMRSTYVEMRKSKAESEEDKDNWCKDITVEGTPATPLTRRDYMDLILRQQRLHHIIDRLEQDLSTLESFTVSRT